MRVSRSGGWMSVIKPHSKRDLNLPQRRDLLGGLSDEMTVTDLVQGVEGVEELLLDPLLALEELDVVDERKKRRTCDSAA